MSYATSHDRETCQRCQRCQRLLPCEGMREQARRRDIDGASDVGQRTHEQVHEIQRVRYDARAGFNVP